MKLSISVLAAASGLLCSPVWAVNTWRTFYFPNCTDGPLSELDVCNPGLPAEQRAASLVAALNITEKLENLVDRANGSARLGLPFYEWWSEALHGVASSPGVNFTSAGPYQYATSFPMPIVMSAAFDNDLVYQVASTVSTEARAFSNGNHANLDFYTPNINPYKDPRWGRGSETPGEDPFRIKGYVKALLEGLEAPGVKSIKKVLATCKHFAGYDMEIWYSYVRYGFNATIGIQDLSEYYLPPFQQCARDSKVASVMCSYNAINGTPSCANSYILQDILRDHWNWTGDNNYVVSDCNGILDITENHDYTATLAEGAAVAYNAGTDNVCEVPPPSPTSWPLTDQVGAYQQGLLTEAAIDRSLTRLYEGLTLAGYFDGPDAPYRDTGWDQVSTPAAQALALQAAVEGFVLKKNSGLLPLDFTGKSVAVIGMWANSTTNILGGYSGIPPYIHNPLYAANALGLTTYYAAGPTAQNTSVPDVYTANALTAANQADIILYCGGNDNTIEAEALDRYNITWPSAQLALIETLAGLGKPLVVAELGNQDDDTPLLANANVSAIVWCGFPGQSGGTALFDILTGKSAPAGRLPVTQYPGDYVNEVELVNMYLRPGEGAPGPNPGRTYRWYTGEPVLPFGFGLHYTNFSATIRKGCLSASYAISDLMAACSEAYPDLCAFPKIGISVANKGSVTSDFVALAFLTGSYGPVPYPNKTLTAYTRLFGVAGGATATGTLEMTLGNLARVDDWGNLVLYPGNYTLLLDVPTADQATFELTGDAVVLDNFPQPPADPGAAVPA